MKNASLVLNVFLVAAVAVLFYLHFSSNKKTTDVKMAGVQTTSSVPSGNFSIAYFEMDSLMSTFEMAKDLRKELGLKEEQNNRRKAALQKKYNDKLIEFQNGDQAKSQVQSEAATREIAKLQNDISAEFQGMDQEFQNVYVRKQDEMRVVVEKYLQDYSAQKNFKFVFAYEPGKSFIFYRDSAYNITSDLIRGLNAQYKKK